MNGAAAIEAVNALEIVRSQLRQVADSQKRISGQIALSALTAVFADPSLAPPSKRQRRSRPKQETRPG